MSSGSDPSIKGNLVFDPSTKLWIPYRTRSDALLAHLRLHKKVPSSLLDSVLKVIHDPTFDSTKVTLNSSADVDAQISEYRGSISFQITKRHDNAAAGLPFVVLEQVIDQIFEQMGDCVREALNKYPDDNARQPLLQRRDLMSMSLVHRTWTLPAQRGLRRRVVINSDRRLQLFVRSPHCGLWVQELIYTYDPFADDDEYSENGSDDRGSASPDGRWQLLAGLLQRLPNLRFLALETACSPIDEEQFKGFEAFFPPLGTLSRLEGLCITCFSFFDSATCPFLISLCAQLHRLTNLKYLHIVGLNCDWDDMDSPVCAALSAAGPPASLKTLSLELSSRACIPRHFLAWLLAPRGDYALDRLQFVAYNQPDHAVVPLMSFALDTGLESVKELYVKLPDDYGVGGSPSIFSRCRNLTTLHLAYSPTCPLLVLPPSLLELRLYGEYKEEPSENCDRDSLTLLVANTLPNLRSVTVFPYIPYGNLETLADSSDEALPLTARYCRDAGVELHFLTVSNRTLDRMQKQVASFLLQEPFPYF